MKKAEEMLRRTQADKDEQEVALDKLRLELSRAEQHKKDLQHQVSYFISNCRQSVAATARIPSKLCGIFICMYTFIC
jgi:hypothetical protein